ISRPHVERATSCSRIEVLLRAGARTMVAARDTMHAIRTTPARLAPLIALAQRSLRAVTSLLAEVMPKGLYARALIIIIAPIVLLQCVVAFTFMERHWQAVTRRLVE